MLHIEGETSHFNDQKIINVQTNGDLIYLFYRDIHHTPFTYYGEVILVEYKIYSDKPSIFILLTSKSMEKGTGSYSAEYQNNTSTGEGLLLI